MCLNIHRIQHCRGLLPYNYTINVVSKYFTGVVFVVYLNNISSPNNTVVKHSLIKILRVRLFSIHP